MAGDAMQPKENILEEFKLFSISDGGFGEWINKDTDEVVFNRLSTLGEHPLSAVQLNQLLVLGREAPLSDGFFRYYWLQVPEKPPYNILKIPDFSEHYLTLGQISSFSHLKWGLYRFYVDALLYFGNIRTAYRKLRNLDIKEIGMFFDSKRFDIDAIIRRGPPLPLKSITKDDRYLISEMACKSYGELDGSSGDLHTALLKAYTAHFNAGNSSPTIRDLLTNQAP